MGNCCFSILSHIKGVRQDVILSPKLFALHMNSSRLSGALSHCTCTCQIVYIRTEPLTYVRLSYTVKYVRFVSCEDEKNGDILRQLISLYAKSNKVTCMFNHCTVAVKLLLIKSYCTSFYCGSLWTDYKFMTFTIIKAAFKYNRFRIAKVV